MKDRWIFALVFCSIDLFVYRIKSIAFTLSALCSNLEECPLREIFTERGLFSVYISMHTYHSEWAQSIRFDLDMKADTQLNSSINEKKIFTKFWLTQEFSIRLPCFSFASSFLVWVDWKRLKISAADIEWEWRKFEPSKQMLSVPDNVISQRHSFATTSSSFKKSLYGTNVYAIAHSRFSFSGHLKPVQIKWNGWELCFR